MIFTEHDCLLPAPTTVHDVVAWRPPDTWRLDTCAPETLGAQLRWADETCQQCWRSRDWMQVVRIDGLCPSIYPEDNQCDHCGTSGKWRWYYHEGKLCCGMCVRTHANDAALYVHSGTRRYRVATCVKCSQSLSLHVGQLAPSVYYAGKKPLCRQCHHPGDGAAIAGRWTVVIHDLTVWLPLAVDTNQDMVLVNTDPRHVDYQQLAVAVHDDGRWSVWRMVDLTWESLVGIEESQQLQDVLGRRGMVVEIKI